MFRIRFRLWRKLTQSRLSVGIPVELGLKERLGIAVCMQRRWQISRQRYGIIYRLWNPYLFLCIYFMCIYFIFFGNCTKMRRRFKIAGMFHYRKDLTGCTIVPKTCMQKPFATLHDSSGSKGEKVHQLISWFVARVIQISKNCGRRDSQAPLRLSCLRKHDQRATEHESIWKEIYAGDYRNV